MKSITGYSENISQYELFSLLAEKVINGDIDNYGSICDILEQLPQDKRVTWVYPRLFALIRSLYWGFFKDLDKAKYPEMWKTFVLESEIYPGTGRLKKNSKILTLFAGLLDIHGYTSFCQKAGRNLSMLQILDTCIQKDIRKIAAARGVICQRSRGDEIILLGCKASAVFGAVIDISNFFGRKHSISSRELVSMRTSNSIMLPEMKVSAGISGGQKYIPLLITKSGDLSGHLVNSAARLQNRANKLAPHDTKILMTRQVLTKLKMEMSIDNEVRDLVHGMYFRDSGGMEFKGTRMGVIDVIFRKEELYKRKLNDGFNSLYSALEKEQWERQIFEEALGLVRSALGFMDSFAIQIDPYGKIKNSDIISECSRGLDEFLNNNQYDKALTTLQKVYRMVREVPHFDHLLLEYLEEIVRKYENLGTIYLQTLESMLEEKAEYLIPIDMRDMYVKAKKEVETYQRIRKLAIEHPKIGNRKVLWLRIVNEQLKNKNR